VRVCVCPCLVLVVYVRARAMSAYLIPLTALRLAKVAAQKAGPTWILMERYRQGFQWTKCDSGATRRIASNGLSVCSHTRTHTQSLCYDILDAYAIYNISKYRERESQRERERGL